jgi:recombination protein RecA
VSASSGATKTQDITLKVQRKFGFSSAATGRFIRTEDVIPTGILALDYALGTGGWPCGSLIEIFGVQDIGKSLLGLLAVREAQRENRICAWVAVEPGFDSSWAEKHGVNMDQLVVTWPDDGLDAFNHLQMLLDDDDVSMVVFDSIGALLRPSEAELQGSPSQGGQAGLITWGVKRAQMSLFKKNKYALFLNQARDIMSGRVAGLVESPGGRALKHTAEIRIQLKPGNDKYMIKDGDNEIMAGRQVIAEIRRTKRDEGTGKRALFDLFSMETDKYPFGVDSSKDIMLTAVRTKIIEQSGPYYYYANFPAGRLQGKEKVQDWIKTNPDGAAELRRKVIDTIR